MSPVLLLSPVLDDCEFAVSFSAYTSVLYGSAANSTAPSRIYRAISALMGGSTGTTTPHYLLRASENLLLRQLMEVDEISNKQAIRRIQTKREWRLHQIHQVSPCLLQPLITTLSIYSNHDYG